MTNSEQALREKAINIFADIFAAGGESHEVGGQSFDQLQQSGYIDRKITGLTALISEHYYPKEFVEWCLREVSSNKVRHPEYAYMMWIDGTGLGFTCLDDVFDYWTNNVKQ